ncbi:MerR family transcriptional regulator [Actinoplanes sp. NPDC049118]|uniref:MerR family transcriptional regulator n=1 Tax=Actinoplanes sp. NPDC049118 TaxID=3155769 RepID=UPI0033DB786E
MLTIGQLAAYTGVTLRAVRHYHQIGLLPEPQRDASGYRRYSATAVVSLIKIRTLADAGVPLSQVAELLEADTSAFAEAVERIDNHLRDEIERLESSRKQIAQLAVGDRMALPPEVVAYLDRLREIGASDRMVEAADIMAGLAELAYASGEIELGEAAHDDLSFDLLDALSVEYDPRAERLIALMRERGWDGWTRLERLPERPR